MSKIELLNEDCMVAMARYPDKYFDLACVDPPYGIGFDREYESMVSNKHNKKWFNPVGVGYDRKEWDKCVPGPEYFKELFRVSKNQIVWGGNYFELPQSPGWIFWDKGVADGMTLSPGELAWTSFDKSVNKLVVLWAGFRKGENVKRIHPTQKPVKVYEWLLTNYAKPGQRILDTHLGSGSSAIAAHNLGFDFVGMELDADYYAAAVRRFEAHKAQQTLFQPDDYDRVTRDYSQESLL